MENTQTVKFQFIKRIRVHFYTTFAVVHIVRFCAAPKFPLCKGSLSEAGVFCKKPTYDRNHRSV